MAKYVEVFFRYKIRFATIFLIPFAVAALVTVTFANYRATATLEIADPASFGATFVPIGWSSNLTPAQNLADGVNQVVRTGAFSTSLSDMLSSSGAAAGASDARQVAASVVTGLKIGTSGSHLVDLTYSCHRSDVCSQALGDAITVLQAQLVQSMRDQATSTTTFWSGQLKDDQANLATAQAAVQSYAAANPGATMDSSSTDPQVILLLDSVRQWKAKVAEAQDSLSLAQYQSTASARLMQIGITTVDRAHLAGSRYIGDGTSLIPAAAVLVVGLGAAALLLFLVVWADKTVRDPRSIEKRLGVPVVATIPRLVGSRGV